MKKNLKLLALGLVAIGLNACKSALKVADVKNVAVVSLHYRSNVDPYDDIGNVTLNATGTLAELLVIEDRYQEELKKIVFSGKRMPFNLVDPDIYINEPRFERWVKNAGTVEMEKMVPGFAGSNALTLCMRPNEETKAMLTSLPPEVDAIMILGFAPAIRVTEKSKKLLAKNAKMKDFKINTYAQAVLLDRNGKLIKILNCREVSKNSAGELSPGNVDKSTVTKLITNSSYAVYMELAEKLHKKSKK
jgi:hypothetical protein